MNITEIPISDLDPDPDNIRDDASNDIAALAADIAEKGLQTPLHVYPSDARYKIWGGHRRWAALCMNGARTAACIIKPAPGSPVEKLDGMVSENLHRQQLNPIEEAKVYRRYLEAGLVQKDIAGRCGVAPSKVSTYLQMLTELTPDEQRRVAAGEVSPGRALKTVRERRITGGRARSDAGNRHAMSVWVPHFNRTHPLVEVAASRCHHQDHTPEDKVGGACGVCWEWAIRRDERVATELDNAGGGDSDIPAEAVAETPVLACSRCGVPYERELKHAQCVVIDRVARKRVMVPAHNWVHANTARVAARVTHSA